MTSRRVAARLELRLREPFVAVARDGAHEVVEEHVLALDAREKQDRAERVHLPRDPAGMVFAEVDAFLERELRIEAEGALMDTPVERAGIDRVADHVHAAAAFDQRDALGMALWIGLFEVANGVGVE